jgi:V-type H+-transporting ATPase subunit C
MHICAIRIFAESILRYGLPPQFLAAVLAPSAKNEKRVRKTLENLCDGRNSAFWKSDEDSGMMGLAGGDADVHPYVSITVNLSS